MSQEMELLKELTQKTNSELILFFVLFIIAMVAIIPLYRMMLKDKKEKLKVEADSLNTRQDKYIEREREIIKVITANTEVMAGLKTTIENNTTVTSSSIMRIYDKIDLQGKDVEQIKALLDNLVREQQEIQDTVQKTLLIVDSIPNTSRFSSQRESEVSCGS